jgi:uncharacterized protein involved in response to NO
MNIALDRRRNYAGPAFFSYGFRPFFFAAAGWAALGVALWVPQYLGLLALPTHMGALDWHNHEMLFGYVAAAIAGFLLTAVPNWTGRLPINGAPLISLFALWLAGRLAIAFSQNIGGVAAAVIDLLFLVVLAAAAAREILAGKNWRNLRVLVVLLILIAANITFHAEVLVKGAADYGVRLAIAAVILLVSLVGGRIVPSFTNNWLTRNNPGRLPVPFSRFDVICMAAGAFALAAWTVAATSVIAGVLLLAAGALHAARLARWAGDRTVADRLVLVLHIGYAFVPFGFLLNGLSVFWPDAVPPSAGVHAWMAGAAGIMTLAVMTRATRGHTGRELVAPPSTQLIYALAVIAALLRVIGAMAGSLVLIEVAAIAWVAAFGGFLAFYGPALVGQRPGWQNARG